MNPYNIRPTGFIKRPYLLRNPLISQVLSGANPLKLFALVGRFAPATHVEATHVEIANVAPTFRESVVSGPEAPTLELNPISIVIMDETWVSNNLDKDQLLSIDFIPTSLSYSPTSTLTPIKVVGTNNPPYHYSGSEDTLTFKIDWYGYREDPVIKKCRFIESLCKADGWTSGPPIVRIYWGETNRLFESHEFVVIKAPYVMKTFLKNKTIHRGTPTPYHLWPIHATQTITLKRITDHQLTHTEIRKF